MNASILVGDTRARMAELPDGSVQCCVTSPPYFGLRDYGHAGQIGLEPTPDAYVAALVDVFREVRRVLADDGTLWLNLGDSFCSTDKWGGGKNGNTGKQTVADDGSVPSWGAVRQRRPDMPGIKPKDLIGIPWMVAFALRADGWYLRQDIIWHKPNPMPESVTDRCTKAHEYLFLLSPSSSYYFDAAAIAERSIHAGKVVVLGDKSLSKGQANGARVAASGNGTAASVTVTDTRNRRDVWTIATQPYDGAHFATMPEALVEPCILAGSRPGDTILDPFAGSGTVGVVALARGRAFVGCELNPEYAALAEARIRGDAPLFNVATTA